MSEEKPILIITFIVILLLKNESKVRQKYFENKLKGNWISFLC